MDECNQVIANIPVRKGLEERYCVHINVASDVGKYFKSKNQVSKEVSSQASTLTQI